MRKLLNLTFKFLAIVLLVSSMISRTAVEKDRGELSAADMQRQNFYQACVDYNFPEIERLIDADIANIPGRFNLLNAIMSDEPQSKAVVKLLIDKGVSVNTVGDPNHLECALAREMPFDYKKAKVAALLEAGVHVDWNKIDKATAAAQAEEERRGSSSKHLLTPEEWRDLLELIVNKVEDDRQLTAIVYPVLLEQLPVDGVADLAGQYTVPYWDGRNQTPETAQEQKDDALAE